MISGFFPWFSSIWQLHSGGMPLAEVEQMVVSVMSSAAFVPSLLAHHEPSATRPVLRAVPAAVSPTPQAAVAVPASAAAVPRTPSVAELHTHELGAAVVAAAVANAVAPADEPAADQLQACTERGGDALVAMLPSLERRAYRWCRDPAEARDLAQDTVLRALGKNPKFDSEGHLRAWLYTVLRNLFISKRRREQSWQRACGELSLADAAEVAPGGFLTPSVERALASLPEAFARVVRLVDLEDYTYADAASTLGVPVGTVMSRLFRARQRLAQQLPALI
jgi:RNA polymerase sigma-70 factor, ECF subfamily